MSKRRTSKPAVELRPGDLLLLGTPGISMPSDWYFGVVVWAGDGDVLVKKPTLDGDQYKQLYTIEHVVAVATDWSSLNHFKQRCATGVRDLSKAVHDTELKLQQRRAAVWQRLEDIAAAGPVRLGEAVEIENSARARVAEKRS